MQFIKKLTKDLDSNNSGIMVGSSEPPRYWYSTGNYLLNKIISGSYINGGIPQGRVTSLTGPSGAGKSFVLCNIAREAQAKGAFVVVVDTENALDDNFVKKIGVCTDADKYMYISVSTMEECKKFVAAFLKAYKAEYGEDVDAREVLILIDSLDMLVTDTEYENFESGVTKGDQGRRNKILKAMLREFVQAIKYYNIAIVVTSQVYANQDKLNGEGRWIVSDAIKFALSQIVLLTKLKLKDSKSVACGIRMKCEGYKTRFTQPFQTVTIEVPYETGMDKYNGLLEVAKNIGVVQQKGAWYNITGETDKWYAKNVTNEQLEYILQQCENKSSIILEANEDEDDDIEKDPIKKSISKKREEILEEKINNK